MATREPKYSNEDPVQPKINYFLKKKYNQGSSLSLSRRKMNQNLHCISFIGCSVHGTFQARILEWIAISFSRASSQPSDQNLVSYVSCMAGGFFTISTPWETPRYASNTTLMAESQEDLKFLLMRVKEESEKAGLKLNIKKMKIMTSSPITSWQIEGENVEAVIDFLGFQNHCRWCLQL